MMRYRKKYVSTDRFDDRSEIKDIIQGRAIEDFVVDEADLEEIVKTAVDEAAANPISIPARLKKTWAIALMRDFKYGNRNYKYLKGIGLSGLYAENYVSSSKIDKL
jgi:hypothetical protein